MALETHINSLLQDVETAYKELHGAVDKVRAAELKVKEWYAQSEPTTVAKVEQAVQEEAKTLEADTSKK